MALLEVSEVSIGFGGIRAVDGVSFAVEAGEVFSIIGPNGAGKTTLFNLISRIYDADAGRIVYDGREITEAPPHTIVRGGIARTFQNINLFEHSTVLDNLMLGRYRHDRSNLLRQIAFTPFVRNEKRRDRRKVEEVIDFLELEKYRDKYVSGLPYGVRKVIELGRALATEPRLLLLDEPSSGLNPEERNDLIFWIQDMRDDLNITIVMIEHDMGLVSAVSDRVLAVNSGRVLALGAPAEVQRNPDVIAAYLGD
ncbi:MAG: ABC transporter ATP-binding protein [Alphaproteobacteria bacterium]